MARCKGIQITRVRQARSSGREPRCKPDFLSNDPFSMSTSAIFASTDFGGAHSLVASAAPPFPPEGGQCPILERDIYRRA